MQYCPCQTLPFAIEALLPRKGSLVYSIGADRRGSCNRHCHLQQLGISKLSCKNAPRQRFSFRMRCMWQQAAW